MNETVLRDLLVCPVCKGRLVYGRGRIDCVACGRQFPQLSADWINLLPAELAEEDETDWERRQQECDGWYADLLSDAETARNCFEYEFAPYADWFASLAGTVLDIGGGNGLVRHYLAPGVRYITLEPSTAWLRLDVQPIADAFPCLASLPCFVRGIGEYLPFADASFEAVLSLWSLNHVSEPGTVFGEAYRVLRPNGRFLIILEDMPPSWYDVLGHLAGGSQLPPDFPRLKLEAALSGTGWPRQEDHIVIEEKQIRRWTQGKFRVARRKWVQRYLTFELQRIG